MEADDRWRGGCLASGGLERAASTVFQGFSGGIVRPLSSSNSIAAWDVWWDVEASPCSDVVAVGDMIDAAVSLGLETRPSVAGEKGDHEVVDISDLFEPGGSAGRPRVPDNVPELLVLAV